MASQQVKQKLIIAFSVAIHGSSHCDARLSLKSVAVWERNALFKQILFSWVSIVYFRFFHCLYWVDRFMKTAYYIIDVERCSADCTCALWLIDGYPTTFLIQKSWVQSTKKCCSERWGFGSQSNIGCEDSRSGTRTWPKEFISHLLYRLLK